jgi:outer membrane protein OmpA-like peptidoglycan-associated protein
MHSDPVVIYEGTTDANGNFNEIVTIPASACLAAGLHSLTLTGITPADTPTSDTAKFTLVDGCKVGATAKKTGSKEWTLSGFLFDYRKAALTKGGKSSLDALTQFIKGAKSVTILGYTQTDTKSAAVKAQNLILAKNRTLTVERYLKSKGIVTKWATIGKGGVDPVSLADQSQNRRVVIRADY